MSDYIKDLPYETRMHVWVHLATECNELLLVDVLLRAGANPFLRNILGQQLLDPMSVACHRGYTEIRDLLHKYWFKVRK